MTTQPNSSKPTIAEQRIITAWRKAASIREAAESLGVTYQRVYQVLRRHSLIERQHVRWAEASAITLRMSTRNVAAAFGCSESAVRGARLRRRAA